MLQNDSECPTSYGTTCPTSYGTTTPKKWHHSWVSVISLYICFLQPQKSACPPPSMASPRRLQRRPRRASCPPCSLRSPIGRCAASPAPAMRPLWLLCNLSLLGSGAFPYGPRQPRHGELVGEVGVRLGQAVGAASPRPRAVLGLSPRCAQRIVHGRVRTVSHGQREQRHGAHAPPSQKRVGVKGAKSKATAHPVRSVHLKRWHPCQQRQAVARTGS